MNLIVEHEAAVTSITGIMYQNFFILPSSCYLPQNYTNFVPIVISGADIYLLFREEDELLSDFFTSSFCTDLPSAGFSELLLVSCLTVDCAGTALL